MHLYSEHVILRQRDVVAAAEHWSHDTPQLPHVHEFMEIVVVVAGTAVHRTRSGSSRISVGTALLVRPGQWHAYDDPKDFQIWNVYIPTETLGGELAGLRSHPVLAAFTSASVATGRAPGPGSSGSRRPYRDRAQPAFSGASTIDLKALEPYLEDSREALSRHRSEPRPAGAAPGGARHARTGVRLAQTRPELASDSSGCHCCYRGARRGAGVPLDPDGFLPHGSPCHPPTYVGSSCESSG